MAHIGTLILSKNEKSGNVTFEAHNPDDIRHTMVFTALKNEMDLPDVIIKCIMVYEYPAVYKRYGFSQSEIKEVEQMLIIIKDVEMKFRKEIEEMEEKGEDSGARKIALTKLLDATDALLHVFNNYKCD